MSERPVAFVMGSDSDLEKLEGAFAVLEKLEIGFHVRVLSAHRTPEEAGTFAREAQQNVPLRVTTRPSGKPGRLCRAKAKSGSSAAKRGSPMTAAAPAPVSSAG